MIDKLQYSSIQSLANMKQANDSLYDKYFSDISYEDMQYIDNNIDRDKNKLAYQLDVLSGYEYSYIAKLLRMKIKSFGSMRIILHMLIHTLGEVGFTSIALIIWIVNIILFTFTITPTAAIIAPHITPTDGMRLFIIILIGSSVFTFIITHIYLLKVTFKQLKFADNQLKSLHTVLCNIRDYKSLSLYEKNDINTIINDIISNLCEDNNLRQDFMKVYLSADSVLSKEIQLYFDVIYNILNKQQSENLQLNLIPMKEGLEVYMRNIVDSYNMQSTEDIQTEVDIISQCLKNR